MAGEIQSLKPRNTHHPCDDRANSAGRIQRDLELLPKFWVRVKLEQFQAAENHRERVIDLMGGGVGKLGYGAQSLRATLRLEQLGVADGQSGLTTKVVEEVLVVRAEPERLATCQGQHGDEYAVEHDRHAVEASQSVTHPPIMGKKPR